MRAKVRVKRAVPLAVTLVGVMGLLAPLPAPVVGQANPPQSAQQSAELEEAKRLHQQAIKLYNQGQYAAAIPLAERALAIHEQVLGKEHPNVASSLNNLAALYQDMGNYRQAEPLYQRSLSIRENVLGKEHPNVASSLNGLAGLYQDMGNYRQAEPLYQRSLTIREKVLGKEHPNVAASLNNLAELYRDMGNYSQAEPLYKRSLSIRENVLGKEHPSVAVSLNNLALLYQDIGNYSQAESLFQRSLAIKEKVLGKEHLSVATSLNNLALLYQDMGNYSQAEPLLQRALAIYEKVLGKEHPSVATSLSGLASLYRDRGNYSQAKPLLQRSLAIYEKVLGKEHPSVAISLNNLASLYRDMGNYSQAEPLFQRALAIDEKVLGKEHPSVATSLNNLASLYRDMGNYTQAEPLFQRALAIRNKVLPPDHPSIAQSINDLALLYREQGDYQKVEPLLLRALAIYEKTFGTEHLYIASNLSNLAALYRDQGNYQKVEPLLQRALAIREKALNPEHPDVANNLNNLAALYYDQGNYQKAEPLLQRALTIFEKVLSPEHPDVANSLNSLAALYQAQGNYRKAEPLLQRALTIREKVLSPEHPNVADSLDNLASLYANQGNDQKAEPLYQRALAIRKKVLGSEHPDVAASLNNLALLYHNQENDQKAEPLYQRALAIREKVFGSEHPSVATILSNLALFYYAKGDIPRALEVLTRSTNIEEQNLARNLSIGSEADKIVYMNTFSSQTNATVSLQIQGVPNNKEAIRLALTTILRRKGRVIDVVSDNLKTLRQNLNPNDQALLDQLAATRSQFAALIFHKPENLPPENYYKQITTLEAQANELEATLARNSPQFRTEIQPVTIEAVQNLIPTDAALIEFVRYAPFNTKAKKPDKQWGTERYVAYILQPQGEPKWVDLGEAEPIDQAVADFRNALQSETSDIKPVARALDEKLMQPIRKLLGNTRNVLLSPDSQLNLIPFAALVDENNRYLVENYSINYLSSGRDLLRLQNHTKSRSEPVIVANPNYEQPGDPASVAIITRGESSQIAASQPVNLSTKPAQNRGFLGEDRSQQVEFTPLPNTAEEANAIAPMLPGATLLTGSQATENAIKQLQQPKILHIATHGFFFSNPLNVALYDSRIVTLPGNPLPGLTIREKTSLSLPNPGLRSGLALAGANIRQSGNEDGILTASEAAGLHLSGTKLVVLSACKTGLGDAINGQGVYGLRRALAIAGAESQLMSLWAVNDYRTNKLMVNYYQRLKNHVGRSEALRQTQLEMLQKPESQHPYYWAVFIPSGDWTPMEF